MCEMYILGGEMTILRYYRLLRVSRNLVCLINIIPGEERAPFLRTGYV